MQDSQLICVWFPEPVSLMGYGVNKQDFVGKGEGGGQRVHNVQ